MLAFADVEHRADQKANHVVKKPIGLNVEYEAAITLAPGRVGDNAAMIITFRCRSLDGERPEAVIALDQVRRRDKPPKIERLSPD
jgi:hypothetical protein